MCARGQLPLMLRMQEADVAQALITYFSPNTANAAVVHVLNARAQPQMNFSLTNAGDR